MSYHSNFRYLWFVSSILLVLSLFSIAIVGCSRIDEETSPGDIDGSEKRSPCPIATVTYSDPGTFDEPWYPGSGGIKDFSLIKVGNTIHLFHITDPGRSWQHGGERLFGHATSQNLRSWTTLSRIDSLYTNPELPNSWSESGVWAPHVVEHNGEYFMFYTGVEFPAATPNSNHFQRIGLAKSTDLNYWERYNFSGENGLILDGPDPIDHPWSEYYSGQGMHDLRDPFVFDNGSEYVMFVSTKANDENGNTALVIAYATSSNLVDWEWGDHWIRGTWPPPRQKAESPNLVKYGDNYFLMWTFKSNAMPNGAVKIAYSTNIFGPYTLINNSSPLFGLANETMALEDQTVYAAFDDYYILHFKRDLVLPTIPSSNSTVYIKEFPLPPENTHVIKK